MRKELLNRKLEQEFGSLDDFYLEKNFFEGAKKRIWNSLSHSIFNYEKKDTDMERLSTTRAFKIRKFLYTFTLLAFITAGVLYFTPLRSKASELFKVFNLKNNTKLIVVGDADVNPEDFDSVMKIEKMEFNVEEKKIVNDFKRMHEKNIEALKAINIDDPKEIQRLIDTKEIELPDYTQISSLNYIGKEKAVDKKAEKKNELANLLTNYHMNSEEYAEFRPKAPNFPEEVQKMMEEGKDGESVAIVAISEEQNPNNKFRHVYEEINTRVMKVVDQIKF